MTNCSLIKSRQDMGIYSIDELAKIFNISRRSIDKAINNQQLTYISPNNKQRFVYLDVFIEYMNKKGNCLSLKNKQLPKNNKNI